MTPADPAVVCYPIWSLKLQILVIITDWPNIFSLCVSNAAVFFWFPLFCVASGYSLSSSSGEGKEAVSWTGSGSKGFLFAEAWEYSKEGQYFVIMYVEQRYFGHGESFMSWSFIIFFNAYQLDLKTNCRSFQHGRHLILYPEYAQ